MDFRMGDKSDAFGMEVREFLAEHMTDEIRERAHHTGTVHDWGLHKALGDKGWLGASWPEEYGGQGRDPFEVGALRGELSRVQAPLDGMATTMMIAGVIRAAGTEQQRRQIVPPALAGDILICLGYSEPDCGSDVAAAATRAVRDGDEWVIDGSKMFTTLAHEAHYVFMLTRTNTEVPKHKGLTMFIVPMDTPGIEIQPVHTMGGERTNLTFYNGVRVPDSCRVGEVDNGWRVMQIALAFERGGGGSWELDRHLETMTRWATETTDEDGRRPIDDPQVRAAIAKVAIRVEVSQVLGFRTVWGAAQEGVPSHVHGSMGKLFASESLVSSASELLDLLGTEGVLQHGEADAPVDGWIEHAYRHSQVTTIYGGTSEIQRSIIAEHGLGLPRTR